MQSQFWVVQIKEAQNDQEVLRQVRAQRLQPVPRTQQGEAGDQRRGTNLQGMQQLLRKVPKSRDNAVLQRHSPKEVERFGWAQE